MRSPGDPSRIIVVRQLSFHRRWSGFRRCAWLEEPDITQRNEALFARIRSNVENIIRAIQNGHALPALQRRADLHRGHGTVEVNVAFLSAALNLTQLLCPAIERQKKAQDKRIDRCATLHSSLTNIKFVILGARVKPAWSPVAFSLCPNTSIPTYRFAASNSPSVKKYIKRYVPAPFLCRYSLNASPCCITPPLTASYRASSRTNNEKEPIASDLFARHCCNYNSCTISRCGSRSNHRNSCRHSN